METDAVAFLLGAGASIDAKVPNSYNLTEQVLSDICKVLHWRKVALPLKFVVGSLIAHTAAQGMDPYRGCHIEDLISALEFLAKRDRSLEAAFVSEWLAPVYDVERKEPPKERARKFVDDLLKAIHEKVKVAAENRSSPWPHSNFDSLTNEWREQLDALVEEMTDPVDRNLFETALLMVHVQMSKYLWVLDGEKCKYLCPIVDFLRSQKSKYVFTLNYDTVFEVVSARCGVPIDNCLPASGLKNDEMTDVVRLVKLHGSVDWTFHWPEGESQNDQLQERIRVIPYNDPQRDNYKHAIVIGRGNKLTVRGPFLSLLARFENALRSEIGTLVSIGYSFGDDHVNYYIGRWLETKPSARLIVIDPRPFTNVLDGVNQSFFDLHSRYPDRVSQRVEGASKALEGGVKRILAENG